MTIQKAIQKAKNSLIEKASKKGIYENFGQKEVRSISDEYIKQWDYTPDNNDKREALEEFKSWCESYTVKR